MSLHARHFVLATGNPDKAREILEVFTEVTGRALAGAAIEWADGDYGFVVAPIGEIDTARRAVVVSGAAPDVEETGETLEENARIKAAALALATRVVAVADDTGLEVDALDGAPGVYSARYAGPDASYADNVDKLVGALAGVEPSRRTARFATVAIAVAPDGTELACRGTVEGTISAAARGSAGFGYDPLFVPDGGDGRTFAEMTASEKHAISHRGRAFAALAAALDTETEL